MSSSYPLGHRTQLDDVEHQRLSEQAHVVFDPAEDVTRQEFKEETDLNYIIQRYGIPQARGQYGVYDDQINLQEAIRLRALADEAFRGLPEELRQRYGSWGGIIAAADRGELNADDLKVVDDAQNASKLAGSDAAFQQAEKDGA